MNVKISWLYFLLPWQCNWCRKEDLNLRPIAYEATALPTELFRQITKSLSLVILPEYPSEISDKYHPIKTDQTYAWLALQGSAFAPSSIQPLRKYSACCLKQYAEWFIPFIHRTEISIPYDRSNLLPIAALCEVFRVDFKIFDFRSISLDSA